MQEYSSEDTHSEDDSEIEEELCLSDKSEEDIPEPRVKSTDFFVLEFNKPRKTVLTQVISINKTINQTLNPKTCVNSIRKAHE